MASLLFHIVLVFYLLETCTSYTQQITIQVSDTGIDNRSCTRNGESCESLTYVLDRLSTIEYHQSTVVTINVTCNQPLNLNTKLA